MKKLILILLIFSILPLYYVSALEIDNVKSYDPDTKTITIKDSVLGIPTSKVADIKLESDLNVFVMRGQNRKVAEFTITNFENNYDNALRQIEFFNNKNMQRLDREFKYRVKTITGQIDVPDFEQVCTETGNKTRICEKKQIGTHKEDVIEYLNYDKTKPLKAENITIAIFTDVFPNDNVEWIPTFFGVKIEEWATWTDNFNNQLTAYYKLDDLSTITVNSLTNGTNGTTNATNGVTGIINTAYNFSTAGSINFTNPTWRQTVRPFSVNCWVRFNSAPGVNEDLLGSTTNGALFYFNSNGGLVLGKQGIDNAPVSTTKIGVGSWNMITYVYNSTGLTYVFNGTNRELVAYSTEFDANPLLRIGRINIVGGTSPYNLDECGFWNRSLTTTELTDLYNGGAGITFTPPGPTITLNSPVDTYNSTNQTVIFNATVTDTGTIANVTLFIDDIANETNTSGVNGNYIFTKNLSFANHTWKIGSTNSAGGYTNSSSRSLNISQIVTNSQTYNATTTETFTESYIANLSLGSGVSLLSANLTWNGTVYAGSISTSGDYKIISRTLIIPSVNQSTNITFYWTVTLNNGTVFNQNLTSKVQLVQDLSIDNCVTNSILILNYTIYEEDTRVFLRSNVSNTSSNIYVTLSGDFGGNNFASYSTNTTNNSILVCIASSLISGKNYRLDSTIQFTAFDYVTEYYYIENYTLNTSVRPQNISLFLLASNRSQEFLITYKDVNLIPVANAIIEITRQYLSLGQFLTVENSKTDSDGRTVGHFVLNDEVYTIYVKVNGVIVATFDNVKAFCSDISTGDCRINLNQAGSTINPSSFTNYLGISGTESYNDTSKTYTFTFSSSDGTSKNINVTIWKYDNYLNQTICSDTLSSSSGTITCVIPSTYYNNTALVRVYVDGELFSQSIFEITISKSSQLNNSRYFLAFLLLISLPFLAMTSGVWMLIIFIMGLIFAGSIALIDLGGLIGPLSAGLWFIIAIIILIWKINKDDNKL